MPGPIAQAIADFIARRQSGERPIRDAIVGAFQGQPQTQTPAPAVQQRPAPQPAPAPSQPPAGASFVPLQRPGGPAPSPAATVMPMPRPERQSAVASVMPMQRPGSGAVPLPPPNPERMQAQMGPAGPSSPVRMNWGIDVPEQQMAQSPGMLQFTGGMMGGQPPPQFPQQQPPPQAPMPPPPMTPPTGQTMNGVYQPFIPPGAGAEAPPNIATMTMQQLQDYVMNGDPGAEELRQISARLEQLRVEALMMGQGVVPQAPAGVPGGPGV